MLGCGRRGQGCAAGGAALQRLQRRCAALAGRPGRPLLPARAAGRPARRGVLHRMWTSLASQRAGGHILESARAAGGPAGVRIACGRRMAPNKRVVQTAMMLECSRCKLKLASKRISCSAAIKEEGLRLVLRASNRLRFGSNNGTLWSPAALDRQQVHTDMGGEMPTEP